MDAEIARHRFALRVEEWPSCEYHRPAEDRLEERGGLDQVGHDDADVLETAEPRKTSAGK
jgi:hypothetical protein